MVLLLSTIAILGVQVPSLHTQVLEVAQPVSIAAVAIVMVIISFLMAALLSFVLVF